MAIEIYLGEGVSGVAWVRQEATFKIECQQLEQELRGEALEMWRERLR